MSLIFFITFYLYRCQCSTKTRAFIDASTIYMFLTVLFAEFLSLFTAWNHICITILWMIAEITLLLFHRGSRIQRFSISRLTKPQLGFAVLIGIALILSLAKGIKTSPTYPIDSLMYHMTKSYMFAQNESIHNFPVTFGHMLFFGPLNSILIAQFRILLFGSDILSFLPQYWAYLLSIFTVYELCRKLNINRYFQDKC